MATFSEQEDAQLARLLQAWEQELQDYRKLSKKKCDCQTCATCPSSSSSPIAQTKSEVSELDVADEDQLALRLNAWSRGIPVWPPSPSTSRRFFQNYYYSPKFRNQRNNNSFHFVGERPDMWDPPLARSAGTLQKTKPTKPKKKTHRFLITRIR